jgi:hypothetical protein
MVIVVSLLVSLYARKQLHSPKMFLSPGVKQFNKLVSLSLI